jgi:hypothetical protein
MLYNATLLETKLQELIAKDPHLLHYREKLLSRFQQTDILFEKLVCNKSFFSHSSNIKSNTLDAFATGYTMVFIVRDMNGFFESGHHMLQPLSFLEK